MSDHDQLESARLVLQDRMDSVKTAPERNRLGQFATPTVLATDILDYAKTLIASKTEIRFLDPAFGTGSFYSALLRVFPKSAISHATGFEIDPEVLREASLLWAKSSLDLSLADYTRLLPPVTEDQKANLLICNPPYVRHHHLSAQEKLRLQKLIVKSLGIRLSGLAGLYSYFMCLAHAWMAADGLAGWLVPSEFMDVGYGREIKQYLLERVTLLRVHRFDPNDVQFDDALVSSAVVWFRNAKPPAEHPVEFSFGGSLTKPATSKDISSTILAGSPKWSRFPMAGADESRIDQLRLSDLFVIKRGIATGANSFFILSAEHVASLNLPLKFLQPILPSPRNVPDTEIGADAQGNPLLSPQLFLLKCNLLEAEVKRSYPTLWQYLETGVQLGINKGYLSSHREPWYSQEERPATKLLCTYMGRPGTKNGKPFRFILNHSEATAPNVYLMLYPKPLMVEALEKNPELLRRVWQMLNDIPVNTLIHEGRVYGGGLYKLEPRELGNAPLDFPLDGMLEHSRQLSFLS